MTRLLRLGLLAIFAAALSGCGGDDDGGGMPDAAGGGPDAAGGAPAVSVTADTMTVAQGGTVNLTITATNFTLEAPTGQPNAAGHGHYHVYLDNATGADYLAADAAGTVAVMFAAGEPTPGAHTLKVQLMNNDHSPLSPEVADTVDITVQ